MGFLEFSSHHQLPPCLGQTPRGETLVESQTPESPGADRGFQEVSVHTCPPRCERPVPHPGRQPRLAWRQAPRRPCRVRCPRPSPHPPRACPSAVPCRIPEAASLAEPPVNSDLGEQSRCAAQEGSVDPTPRRPGPQTTAQTHPCPDPQNPGSAGMGFGTKLWANHPGARLAAAGA